MAAKPNTDQLEAIIQQQADQIAQLEAEVQRLKHLLAAKADAKAAKPPTFPENYSLDRNTRTRRKKKRKSPGRTPHSAKRELAAHEVAIYAPGVSPAACVRHRSQLAWRILDGKAVYVCYHIYDVPDSRQLPVPPGLRTSRSEFGIEIILIVAFLHYWIGVSLDNVLQILAFFTGLPLSKSQADSLLTQLATDWDEQYDTIAELLALQLIVYIDETGWRVGHRACYTWVFSTTMYVLFRCGVSRQQREATTILGESFSGIGVTDDYGAYKHLFSQHQLCWAHLIRKAIKLALQHPDEPAYATFLDQLCGIYDDARRLRNAELLHPAAPEARQEQVAALQGRIQALCPRHAEPICQDTPPDPEATFIRLQRELVTNLACLFVFVEHPAVEPTNNRSERHLRREAEIRKGARTSKSKAGAQRRSVIMTVLASLQLRISTFTLSAVLAEVKRWLTTGMSLFQHELYDLQPHPPPLAPVG